jgi:hypothetical protein
MLDNKEVDNKPTEQKKPGIIRRVWQWWRRPKPFGSGNATVVGICGGDYFLGCVRFRTPNAPKSACTPCRRPSRGANRCPPTPQLGTVLQPASQVPESRHSGFNGTNGNREYSAHPCASPLRGQRKRCSNLLQANLSWLLRSFADVPVGES